MKTAWILLGCALGCLAQTAVYDTSILKNDNVWVYERNEEERFAGNVLDGVLGTTRFAIDSLTSHGDTLRFRVIQRDSVRTKLMVGNHPDSMRYITTITADTGRFVYFNQIFTPSVPFFMAAQSFSSADTRVLYKGDTVRFHKSPWGTCGWTYTWNLETVGRTLYEQGQGGCGIANRFKRWTLQSFAGEAYSESLLTPVALRAGRMAVKPGTQRALRYDGHGIWIEQGAMRLDMRGRGAPAPVKH